MPYARSSRSLGGAGFLLIVGCTLCLGGCRSTDVGRFRDHFVREAPIRGAGGVTVTYLGATSLLFDDGETRLMVDGFFSRPSLLRTVFRRLRTDEAAVECALGRVRVDSVDALFVAHTHYDHALDVAHVARRTGARLHGSPSTLQVGRGGGLCDGQMSVFRPGQEVEYGRFRVTVLRSAHSPLPWYINDVGRDVTGPLAQPARASAYREGGSYDFLIRHGPNTILVKPSANIRPGGLNGVSADVVFLGVGGLGRRPRCFRDAYYEHAVTGVGASLVVPIHWDEFTRPLSGQLRASGWLFGNAEAALDFLIERTSSDGVSLRLLQGYQSVTLFADDPR